jgi:putative heme-binding domain-containing protein
VDDKYSSHVVVTASGVVVTGMLAEQDDDEMVLRTAERKNVRIARNEIDDVTKSPVSLMPERLLSDMTAQEAADLLAFLMQGP